MQLDPRVAWAIEEMQRRMHEALAVPDLARAVNLSRSRFAHLFREQTGVAPGRYLREFRLDRARLLLETTTLSVKEVMAAVGINDPSHFSRDFQRVYGASPREWRRQRQAGARPPPGRDIAADANRSLDEAAVLANESGRPRPRSGRPRAIETPKS
jgi:transcriptional regulator GlxA family with amidase domain